MDVDAEATDRSSRQRQPAKVRGPGRKIAVNEHEIGAFSHGITSKLHRIDRGVRPTKSGSRVVRLGARGFDAHGEADREESGLVVVHGPDASAVPRDLSTRRKSPPDPEAIGNIRSLHRDGVDHRLNVAGILVPIWPCRTS
jgi:hypothetical protein